jgi:uncharacterized repeat protein (TIGR02543 family)
MLWGSAFTAALLTAATVLGLMGCSFLTDEKDSYTVKFDVHGGLPAPSSQSVSSGGRATRPSDPAMAGYTFAGWYKEAAGTNPWDFAVDTVTGDITLYAKWLPGNSFRVDFNAQGGTPTPESQMITSGGKAAGPTPVPTKEGYALDGWYTEAALTTRWNFDNAVTKDITLHAKWTAAPAGSFVVSFDSTGGGEVASQTIASGGKAAVPTPAPTKANHTLDGWYTEAAHTTRWDFAVNTVTANIVLYAKWTEIVNYAVNFDAHGGSPVPAQQTIASGAKATAPTPTPSRDGFSLEGWYTEAAYTTKWDFAVNTVTAIITLHAKWTEVAANSFVVSFDSKGGSAVSNLIVTSGAKAIKPTDPTREDYTFDGWYTEEAYTTAYNFDHPVTANFTLYAKWTVNFVPVESIVSTIPANATTEEEINLNALTKVNPDTATNKNIVWTVKGTTATGVTNEDLKDDKFTAPNGGTLNLTATIVNGTAAGTPFVRDDISINIVKPVTGITGVSPGIKGVQITLSGAKAVPEDATYTTIVWKVKTSNVAGITVGSAPPFTPTGTGTVTLTATIANGEGIGHDYVKEFEIPIHEPGHYNPEVGFGDETSLSVRDNGYKTIKSGDSVEVTGSSYYITLINAADYDNIVWHINGTKSTVTGQRLTLDTTKKGLVQVTVEAYKDGVFDTGTFKFNVK